MQTCTQPYYDLLTQFKLVVHTCICIAIQSGNLCSLCISKAKRGRKRLSQPPKTEIGCKWVYWNLTGEREKAKMRKGAGPGLCSADGTYLSTLAVNRAEATLFSTLNHLVTAKHSHQPDDDTLLLHFCESTKLWEQKWAQTGSVTPTHSFSRGHLN